MHYPDFICLVLSIVQCKIDRVVVICTLNEPVLFSPTVQENNTMRATILNRLALVFIIGAILTVMTGSVSAATMPEAVSSTSTFSMGEWDADACPYSSHSGGAKFEFVPTTQ